MRVLHINKIQDPERRNRQSVLVVTVFAAIISVAVGCVGDVFATISGSIVNESGQPVHNCDLYFRSPVDKEYFLPHSNVNPDFSVFVSVYMQPALYYMEVVCPGYEIYVTEPFELHRPWIGGPYFDHGIIMLTR